MSLSSDLISQFVKVTNDTDKSNEGTTVYGKIVKQGDSDFVLLDGAEQLTPVLTTTSVKDGERVMVTIKNHTAIVTGNISSPSASENTVIDMGNKVDDVVDQISEFEIVIADKVSTSDFDAEKGRIDDLVSDNVTIKEKLTAQEAEIGDLTADNVTINEKLTAQEAEIENINGKMLTVEVADITYAKVDSLEATDAKINNLEAAYGEFESLTTENFEAVNADIRNLETEKLSTTEADIKYANIEFTNITEAAIKNLFTDSGIIKDLIVSEGHITGELVGVTIKGDLIEAGTLKADRLVVKGSDGIYYKLNIEAGVTATEEVSEEELQSGLHGDTIIAHTITAEKINVDDLVAFDATIGGFKLTNKSIYSGVKESADNITSGIYMDNEGQFVIGNNSDFIKFVKNQNGKFKLEISANSIILGSSGSTVETEIEDIKQHTVKNTVEEFYQSKSPFILEGGSWSTEQPTWTDGLYIWRRTKVTYGDNTTEYTPSEEGVCITGNTGQKGEDSILLQIVSSNGNMFKNSTLSTTLTITIIVGDKTITSSREMYETFGSNSYLEWEEKTINDDEFTILSKDDSRLSDNGFILTLSPQDVYRQTVFNCRLIF